MAQLWAASNPGDLPWPGPGLGWEERSWQVKEQPQGCWDLQGLHISCPEMKDGFVSLLPPLGHKRNMMLGSCTSKKY